MSEVEIDNVQEYREFCHITDNIPVFSQAWWMDAAAGENNWHVILIKEGGNIVATLPYVLKKKLFLDVISQPVLTQKNGITFHGLNDLSYNKRLSAEKRIVNEVISQLPKYSIFSQTFDHTFTNWLPFYWSGFKQTTRYSYRIDDISNPDLLKNSFAHAKRKDLKKAMKSVSTFHDLDPSIFYRNHEKTLAKQNKKISYSAERFFEIVMKSYDNNAGKTFFAKDDDGNIHAAVFVIWDKNCAYYLISTIDPEFRRSGSTSYLLMSVFEYLKDKTKAFDFEGSMIEQVEYSFRQFGGQQKQLFEITHVPNRFLRAALSFVGRI